MYELLWFLLPVAAVSGWYVSQKSGQGMRFAPEKQIDLNTGYYQGINYLLNEQPDKALDVFVKMLEVNSETVELHLALGSLFRRRGEVDRAILLHQNLIARPTLAPKQREYALLELANDYLKAGLLDRAERLFLDLKGSKDYSQSALAGLVEVYQQERDWDQAISTAKSYQKVSGKSQSEIIAQYYCEMADKMRIARKNDKVPGILKKALQANSNCVRANLILAQHEMDMFNFKAASKAYLRVIDQDARFFSLAINPLKECLAKLGESNQLVRHLQSVLGSRWNRDALAFVNEKFGMEPNGQEALSLIEKQLNAKPNLRTLSRYVETVQASTQDAKNEIVNKIARTLKEIENSTADYRCEHCGYASHALFWQCPSCKTWDSVDPL